MWYGILADVVVGIHVAYVAYVVLGQLLIILAAPMKWEWARNPWFRFSHLSAIGVVAYEAIRGLRCPLTVWEEQLRGLCGQTFSGSETFMGRILHDIMFIENQPEIFFTTICRLSTRVWSHAWSDTGRQMPLVTNRGPQSQP